ncbi:MAG: hypothetical protein A2Y40_10105 [Candidatus Margulisbacteria bacterium GWF2_35_9]|nr:MAG: hypothetical protein A2Y40_10105 [Candidatus Margulisbacteria bacterium GWF2_35_9]
MRFLIIAILFSSLFAVNIEYYNQESTEVYYSIINRPHALSDIENYFEEYPYSSSYLKALKQYYKIKMNLFNAFNTKLEKKVSTYVYFKELISDSDKKGLEIFSDSNIAEVIYKYLQEKITGNIQETSRFQIQHRGNKLKNMDEEEDVSIIVNVEMSLPEQLKSSDVVDVNVNYQIYMPGVYLDTPILDIYIRQSFVNAQYNYQKTIEKIIKELNKEYGWRDIKSIISYLAGNKEYVPNLVSRIDQNSDDYFSIKLLAVSNWEFLQSKLLKENNAEGLIRANLMYPFSEKQSVSIYQYAIKVYDIKTKIKLLSYLGSAGYKNISFLLNGLLAEIDDINLFELLGPILYIAMENGDDETLEHLYLVKEMVFDYDDQVEQPFIDLLELVIKTLERKYK